jgi:hypothetical protein
MVDDAFPSLSVERSLRSSGLSLCFEPPLFAVASATQRTTAHEEEGEESGQSARRVSSWKRKGEAGLYFRVSAKAYATRTLRRPVRRTRQIGQFNSAGLAAHASQQLTCPQGCAAPLSAHPNRLRRAKRRPLPLWPSLRRPQFGRLSLFTSSSGSALMPLPPRAGRAALRHQQQQRRVPQRVSVRRRRARARARALAHRVPGRAVGRARRAGHRAGHWAGHRAGPRH